MISTDLHGLGREPSSPGVWKHGGEVATRAGRTPDGLTGIDPPCRTARQAAIKAVSWDN
jgi:hypothetical protein